MSKNNSVSLGDTVIIRKENGAHVAFVTGARGDSLDLAILRNGQDRFELAKDCKPSTAPGHPGWMTREDFATESAKKQDSKPEPKSVTPTTQKEPTFPPPLPPVSTPKP